MSDHLTPHAEYERRFLVTDPIHTLFDGIAHPQEIEQAYLWTEGGYAVRVRVIRNPSADESDGDEPSPAGPAPAVPGLEARDARGRLAVRRCAIQR